MLGVKPPSPCWARPAAGLTASQRVINKGARKKNMTDDEIKALVEAKEAAEKTANEAIVAAASARAEAEKERAEKFNVVEELKNARLKTTSPDTNQNLTKQDTDINRMIEEALQRKEAESKKTQLEQAISEFKDSKPEFKADAAGLVFSKFEDGLKRFNFSDIASKEQMKTRLEEVYRFVNSTSSQDGGSDYEGSPSNPSPVNSLVNGTDNQTKEVLRVTGIEETKFKELKNKYPDAFSSLGLG